MQKIKKEILRVLDDAVSDVLDASSVVIPDCEKSKIDPDITDGQPHSDFASSVSFKLARVLKKPPAAIASEIIENIEEKKYAGNLDIIEKIENLNGYINFFIDYRKFSVYVLKEVRDKKERFGSSSLRGQRIVLEHTSVNPSGPVHIGRLRNSLIGDCLARILRFAGYDVETHYYVNDIGKQIAIIACGFAQGIEPDSDVISRYSKYMYKKDFKIFSEYVAANREFESSEKFSGYVDKVIRDAESGKGDALTTISSAARECLSGQVEIFSKLGIYFDVYDFESDYIKNNSVNNILKKLRENYPGYIKDVDGCLALDLSEFGIERKGGGTILSRSDGTSVYLARDLAYHLFKVKKGDRIINVLGEDHRQEFQELKIILENFLGIKTPMEAVHFSFVSFEGRQLSTRKGQSAPVDILIDEAVEKARVEIEKRGIGSVDSAGVIGIGAIKYSMIKKDPLKPITFRWEDALNFDGETSPYIQYAHARCVRILEKAKDSSIVIEEIYKGIDDIFRDDIKITKLTDEEKELIRIIGNFEDHVLRSADELKPNIAANYVYNLASAFSKFYKECRVLGSAGEVEKRRILLVDAARQVIKNGLDLLGIEAPDRM